MRKAKGFFGKNLVVGFVVILMVFALAACSGEKEEEGSSSKPVNTSPSDEKAKTEEPKTDDYPNKTIRFVVPSSAGGGFDTTTRQIQPYFEKTLGTNFAIENHSGGGTAIGTKLVTEGDGDGYTIMITGTPHLHFSYLTTDVGYSLEDLAPIGSATFDPGVIRVQDDAPWKDLNELIEYAKTQPKGKLKASVSFRTSNNFLALKQLENATGVEFTIVPYGGGNEARTALLSGEVDLTHAGAFNSLNIEEGTRVIGVQHSTNDWPDVTDNATTINEQLGTTIPNNSSTYGLFVKAEVKQNHPERYQKLVDAYSQALEDPAFIEAMTKAGEIDKIRYINPDEYGKMNKDLEAELNEVKHLFDE